ncbi:MAG: ATP-binding protein [Spirochaetaceae bacterium]|jgi:predicted AAA+ superfamily ATPase|nr:ATP-binding protein [Spirochaetaceae bacterium]
MMDNNKFMTNEKDICSETLSYLSGVSVFSKIRASPVLKEFEALLTTIEEYTDKPRALISAWASFTSTLAEHNRGRTFFMYVVDLMIADENAFTLQAERGEVNTASLAFSMAENDLKRISMVADFDLPMLAIYISDMLWKAKCDDGARLVDFGVRTIGKLREHNHLLIQKEKPYALFEAPNAMVFADYIKNTGAGLFGKHNFFYWKRGAGLKPALNPDRVRLSELSGYEDERRVIIDNTERFLSGASANNLLLYGDRGTGKSAAVKAVCNEYRERGIRLIELRKCDLDEIPELMEKLSCRGLFFVLFIDDLSFEKQDDDFTMLKAMLEGGSDVKPNNVVVYATSNRRHFVKESFSDRPNLEQLSNGDVRAFDTMQEQLSLADRFGITILFSAPSQEEFVRIAEFIAERRSLFPCNDREKFKKNALVWERWFNGRSPRTAHQFVEWVASGVRFPWEDG